MSELYYNTKENLRLDSLLDLSEYIEVLKIIDDSEVTEPQKVFLRNAATRFIRFNYAKIADYYSSTSAEMRAIIERLHLVVVDRDHAIENGYLKFQSDYNKLIEEILNG